MIDYLHNAAIFVQDVDAAIDFYVDTLGFEKTADIPMGESDRWVTVRPVGSVAALAIRPMGDAPGPRSKDQGNSGISFVSKDLDKTYQELSAKGVAFDGAPQPMPWGGTATFFRDPDGNSFFITTETE